MSYTSGRHLPLGVAILAVLIGLIGVIYLVVGLLRVLTVAVPSDAVPHLLGAGLLGGLVLLVVGAILLLIASGLWHLELWALVLCLIVVGALWLSDLLDGALLSLGGVVLLLLLIYLVAVHREFT